VTGREDKELKLHKADFKLGCGLRALSMKTTQRSLEAEMGNPTSSDYP